MSQATASAPAPRVTDAPATVPVRKRAPVVRRLLRPLLMLGGIAVVIVASVAFWLHGGRYVSIDNAYIRAAKLSLSTDVSGIVADVPVREGQRVKKGDVLVRLDAKKFEIALEGAVANQSQVVLNVESMKRDYARMVRDIEVRKAQLENNQAALDRAESLVGTGAATRASYDAARFAVQADTAAVAALRTMSEAQLAKLGGDPDVDATQTAMYQQAHAQVEEARRQLDQTVIRAPFDGTVTQVDSVQPGMYLTAGTAAFGIVSSEKVWVDANPKETELTYVRVGNPVTVTVDTYPGRTWQGTVCTISPNSGAEFSILPAQNTSGNWVKVVQRIPLRVCLDRHPDDPELRAGMSVVTDIDTGHRRSLRDLWPD